MESFRPGTYYSYRPFKTQSIRRRRRRGQEVEEDEHEADDESRRSPINPVRIPLQLDETSRYRMLYVDVGRPRPFYRYVN